ncbi:MAG: universal stress protein [Pseudomonadales bacterium]
MNPLDRLLIHIDVEMDCQPALARGAWLARECNSQLHLYSSAYNLYLEEGYFLEPTDVSRIRQDHIDDIARQLEALARPLCDEGFGVTHSVGWGTPAWQQILEARATYECAMVVASMHTHPRLNVPWVRHQDWELVRRCPVPLLLAGERTWNKPPRLLAAVDPTHAHDKPAVLDQEILALARNLDTQLFSELHVGHVIDERKVPEQYLEAVRQYHLEQFQRVSKPLGLPQDNLHFVAGEVEEELARLVREIDADVLLMGAVRRGPLDAMLIGSTTERTMHYLDCDLLTVKPEWADIVDTVELEC